MPSQQPSLLCWNQYMDECVEALETSPLALPSDKQFCKHVRLQRATDEHSRNIFVSHFFRPGSMSRPATIEILDSFKRQLATLVDPAPDHTTHDNMSNGIVFYTVCRHEYTLTSVPTSICSSHATLVPLVDSLSSRGGRNH